MPVRVMLAEADATLYGDDAVRRGAETGMLNDETKTSTLVVEDRSQTKSSFDKHIKPSKLNTADDDPTIPAAVIPVVPTRPSPRMPMHAADVAVVQLLVAQLACANTADNVA